jgi:ketosteroid isomerase-like protein
MTEIRDPAQLGATLLAAINGADLESVVECYTTDATLELPDGTTVTGHAGIRAFYAELLTSRPQFEPGEQAPVLVHADIALTTTRVGDTATAEVARRQDDGTWRWILDRPDVLLDRS